MQIDWIIDQKDIDAVTEFVDGVRDTPFVRRRIEVNVERRDPEVSETAFWFRVVACLLTTQQRSGPTSRVSKFISQKPFPLNYKTCVAQADVRRYTEAILDGFGGLRRWKKIAQEIDTNLSRLEGGLWADTLARLRELSTADDARLERSAAEFFDEQLAGFGPKQSRNLLQSLGLTRYEIPVDSRITKWLNSFGFPIELSAQALSDRNYYNFVLDGVQALCRKCSVYPCVLDAAIFASFDTEGWPENGIVW